MSTQRQRTKRVYLGAVVRLLALLWLSILQSAFALAIAGAWLAFGVLGLCGVLVTAVAVTWALRREVQA